MSEHSCNQKVIENLEAQLTEAKKKAERYREALQEIINKSGERIYTHKSFNIQMTGGHVSAVNIAKQALEEKE